jgi:uncharacterized membrane protein YeaQ/YmgE (transglycosylase-associated protein family)
MFVLLIINITINIILAFLCGLLASFIINNKENNQ